MYIALEVRWYEYLASILEVEVDYELQLYILLYFTFSTLP